MLIKSSNASLVASNYNIVWQTHIGAFSVLFLWLKVTSMIGRFPTFGIYINMCNYIFWTLVMFFGIFFFTLWGEPTALLITPIGHKKKHYELFVKVLGLHFTC